MLTLRPFQKSALDILKQEKHLLCIAPTGSGKSLIYERLTQELKLKTLLITPLVALARQQTQSLSRSKIQNIFLSENHRNRPPQQSGVWIMSPESLHNPSHIRKITAWKPDFLVVDECHCLWDWGESFRPAFTEIPKLLNQFKIRRSLWLTATLPREAKAELREKVPALIELGAFSIPKNLDLSVQNLPRSQRLSYLLHWISLQKAPGAIFTSTRQSAERLGRLVSEVTPALCYHAGMSREERVSVEERLRSDKGRSVVSTSAFGMGMDYSHLRWVVLWEAPPSLLSLVQSMGRVTRVQDTPSRALVLWDIDDFRSADWMVDGSSRKRDQLNEVLEYLQSSGCRKSALEAFFSQELDRKSKCYSCSFCNTKHNLDKMIG